MSIFLRHSLRQGRQSPLLSFEMKRLSIRFFFYIVFGHRSLQAIRFPPFTNQDANTTTNSNNQTTGMDVVINERTGLMTSTHCARLDRASSGTTAPPVTVKRRAAAIPVK